MQVLGLLRADDSSERGDPPSPELIEKVSELMEEISKAGVLVGGDGLLPSSAGKRVKLQGGKLTVIDGPFTESKELVASYVIMKVNDMDEAVRWTTKFLEIVGGGESELRPIFTFDDLDPSLVPEGAAEREEAWRKDMEKNA